MKQMTLLFFTALFIFSCERNESFLKTETITNGEKWTLKIGSSPEEVYSQLQQLSTEKQFDAVAIVYRKPFSKPEEIVNNIEFYNAVTLQNKSGPIDRAIIQYSGDKVTSIEAGGALPEPVSSWPEDKSDEIAIHINDPVEIMYEKLVQILETPAYNDYQIILPDKPLNKPFDPAMADYDEWGFTFTFNIRPGRGGISSVRLFFKNGKLSKIRHEYNEADIYN